MEEKGNASLEIYGGNFQFISAINLAMALSVVGGWLGNGNKVCFGKAETKTRGA